MTDSAPHQPVAGAPAVEIVALGGFDEFGLHMLAVSCGETTILIDAGSMFPDDDLPGVDLIVPDLSYLEERRGQVKALVLTHGHEDHVGAVPYVVPHVDGPVYGTALTVAFVARKLEEHEVEARFETVRPRDVVEIGPFRVEFLRVTHSMPDCVAVAIHTPAGVILHTGDFKIDQTPPDGELFDLHRFAELGARGVLALLSDSTNVDRPGVTGAEVSVRTGFEEILGSTEGKVIVGAFASSLYRMQVVLDVAVEFERKVAFIGRGMIENSLLAQRLGHLRIPTGTVIRDVDVASFPAQDVLCLATGSQGEANAALSRIAIDDHRHVKITPGDTVVLSARAIPGNEKAIGRVINHIARRGVDVITDATHHIHVSGHGSAEELKLVLSLVRPRFFIPVHGEYRQRARHARLAGEVLGGGAMPVTVLTPENGEVVRFDEHGATVTGLVTTGRVLIDGTRVGEVGDMVLRDRRHLASDGVLVPVVAINRQTGAIEGVPEVIARGFVTAPEPEAVLTEGAALIAAVIEGASIEERTDPGLIKEKIRVELRRFFKKRTGRRPMVLPVVLEI
ncbi:MAG: ribonuclease J [Vicinamibacterales bacterium]|nr:ribonuclease J [Vicinamibacterales bacterium]